MFQFKSPSKISNYRIYDNKSNDSINKVNNNNNKNKKINYSDYLKLKNAYLSFQENAEKLKEENEKLNSILDSFQKQISLTEDYKLNITQSFTIIEKKYNDLYKENKELKKNYEINDKKLNEISDENNKYKLYINELNNQIEQYQIELLN